MLPSSTLRNLVEHRGVEPLTSTMRMSRADEGSVLTPPGLRLYVTSEKPVSAFVAVSITNQLFYSGHIRFVLCCQNAAHAFTGPGALILVELVLLRWILMAFSSFSLMQILLFQFPYVLIPVNPLSLRKSRRP